MTVIVTPELNKGGVYSGRQQSPAIWWNCRWDSIRSGQVNGYAWGDDFSTLPLGLSSQAEPTITTQIGFGPYKIFATSGSTFTRGIVNAVQTPGLSLLANLDASTHSASIAQAAGPVTMAGSSATDGKLWFEACIATKAITANSTGFFIGLAEVDLWALATGVPFSDGTGAAITSGAAAIGFNLPSNGLGQMQTVYSDRATAFTAVGATDPAKLAAYTFTRVGFSYDPMRVGTNASDPTTCCVQFFQDNVLLSHGLPKTTLAGLTNLPAGSLGLIWANVGGSSVSTGINYCKWWKVAQEFLPSAGGNV